MEQALIEFLSGFVTPRRLALFDRIIDRRTRYITVVLEDIYQPHNASAVLRSCECFGVQDVHIIENRNRYRVNPDVALGSSQWLSLKKYRSSENNTQDALAGLKKAGYRLVATVPRKRNSKSLDEFSLEQGKVAILFGTEMNGLSREAMNMSDEFLYIPMVGFTESLNISVSVAVILYQLTRKLRMSDLFWELSEEEKTGIKLSWLKQTVKKSDLLIERFLKKNS
ncbi:MAG TPA: TrmH family RNA methyltransferase [Bacteroidetes bacterium]|nr:TrmH family RNA methyltransferase [Bacteroidota bacterium]